MKAIFGVVLVFYIGGAFALVGVAVAGLFGKVSWKFVPHVAAGLFMLAIAF